MNFLHYYTIFSVEVLSLHLAVEHPMPTTMAGPSHYTTNSSPLHQAHLADFSRGPHPAAPPVAILPPLSTHCTTDGAVLLKTLSKEVRANDPDSATVALNQGVTDSARHGLGRPGNHADGVRTLVKDKGTGLKLRIAKLLKTCAEDLQQLVNVSLDERAGRRAGRLHSLQSLPGSTSVIPPHGRPTHSEINRAVDVLKLDLTGRPSICITHGRNLFRQTLLRL
jgi:hypothetical protein